VQSIKLDQKHLTSKTTKWIWLSRSDIVIDILSLITLTNFALIMRIVN
jgi:hypothetical protein